jgi:hypothetical protein
MFNTGTFKNLILKYSKLSGLFKSFFIVIVFLILIFGANLFISVLNKPKSAYTALTNKSGMKLQDTRLHNWDEIDKK